MVLYFFIHSAFGEKAFSVIQPLISSTLPISQAFDIVLTKKSLNHLTCRMDSDGDVSFRLRLSWDCLNSRWTPSWIHHRRRRSIINFKKSKSVLHIYLLEQSINNKFCADIFVSTAERDAFMKWYFNIETKRRKRLEKMIARCKKNLLDCVWYFDESRNT